MQLTPDIAPPVHRALEERAEHSGMSLESRVSDPLAKDGVCPHPASRAAATGQSPGDRLASTGRNAGQDAHAWVTPPDWPSTARST